MSVLLTSALQSIVKMLILAACAFAGVMLGKKLKEKKN